MSAPFRARHKKAPQGMPARLLFLCLSNLRRYKAGYTSSQESENRLWPMMILAVLI